MGYKAQIHSEYVPIQKEKDYICYHIEDSKEGSIEFEGIKIMTLDNFKSESLKAIKKRIEKFYPKDSEKGIQGKLVTKHNNFESADGFFLDTEFQSEKCRIDMTWVDIKTKKIYFVELKTISDRRLYIEPSKVDGKIETIDRQLEKYSKFANKNSEKLKTFYDKVLIIKRKLKILPQFMREETLQNYSIVPKPILLVGDCTANWIKQYASKLNDQLRPIAWGCFYHGENAKFYIPGRTKKGPNHIFIDR